MQIGLFVLVALTSSIAAAQPSTLTALTTQSQTTKSYLAKGEVDLTLLLPPPPAPKSHAEKADVRAMLDLQAHRTDAQIQRSTADAELSVFRFADILGPNFSKSNLPILTAFFDRVISSTYSLVMTSKDHWARPRPFEVDPRVHPSKLLREALVTKTGSINPSYPSGHALFGVLCAILLSNMMPEKSDELFARGFEYGHNRVVGLVHFPSDTIAGQLGASAVAQALMSHADFKSDFEKAKQELRSKLK